MGAHDYADIRKFGGDVLGIVTDSSQLKLGQMAVIYGVPIFVRKGIPRDFIALQDEDGRDLAHVFADGDVHTGNGAHFSECLNPTCLVRFVMTC